MCFWRFLDSFLFSNVLIACVAMCIVATSIFAFGLPFSFDYIALVGSATVSSYCFHWWLSRADLGEGIRLIWTHKFGDKLLIISLLFFVLTLCLVQPFLRFWCEFLLLGLLTFFYSAPKIAWRPFLFLRKIAVAKTLYLSVVWTLVTTYMAFRVADVSLLTSHYLWISYRFIYAFLICLLFDYRDRFADSSLLFNPLSRWSPVAFRFLFYVLSFVALLLLFGLWQAQVASSVIVLQLIAHVILMFHLSRAMRSQNDYYYYGFLDFMFGM